MEEVTLGNTSSGQFVILWIDHLSEWSDDVVQIVSKGVIVTVKHRNGETERIYCAGKCKKAYF
tara:strand:- start:743 stop:931 length:189 start_codon:yes stop_codon:yes gene_type:complete